MSNGFWIKRFLWVLAGAFVVICAVQWLKTQDLPHAATHAGLWSVITAAVFTVGRYFQARRGQHCALCQDTPEMQGDTRS